ncbi:MULTISPECIES: hypothetical protein [Ignatzschineria]|mgnify:CR=1 FL=1|uniref:Uncharacterized protein n=1 Tax=Ignatzschineria cameli TaxID=2182793 RepID=A0A2U2AT20_9GAMM|nr:MULTISPECIES: hypothetical protein [Ignatzschineria]MDM1544692.1 hypothetical protein [Ignatzschineria indica]PWD87879.1 hypothetical protein DC077_00945 [Ignatzschineria cameli]PWD90447.1 hypothetical protein DC079_04735 [Ignatzschineria cameli]PWD92331.1 hypothetical protein DC081_04445 [Ignatzschineria cameli]PWD93124.1 hypothetical protein DC078_04735 [Ignatzschineria cameli]
MLYEKKGFLRSVASIFIQGSSYYDYKKITQKSFKEASAEDILEISKDFERVTKKYISDKNIE